MGKEAGVCVSISKAIGNHLQFHCSLSDEGVKVGPHCLEICETGSPGFPATEVIFDTMIIETVKGPGKTGRAVTFEVQKIRQSVFNRRFVSQGFIGVRHSIVSLMVLRGTRPHRWVNGDGGGVWGGTEE